MGPRVLSFPGVRAALAVLRLLSRAPSLADLQQAQIKVRPWHSISLVLGDTCLRQQLMFAFLIPAYLESRRAVISFKTIPRGLYLQTSCGKL